MSQGVRFRLGCALLPGVFAAQLLVAQQEPPPAAGNAGGEIATRREAVTFKTTVQLVNVSVVVRDTQGRAIGSLGKDDFQILDNKKPQVISKFSVIRSAEGDGRTPGAAARGPAAATTRKSVLPDRYVAYVFDDLHMSAAELIRVREAVSHRLAATLGSADRAAVFTLSGVNTVEFTADQELLKQGLDRIMPRPRINTTQYDCPQIDLYQADLMINRTFGPAIQAAVAEARDCMPGVPDSELVNVVTAAARHVLDSGSEESRLALNSLQDAIRSLEVMVGERSIVLISPGFLRPGLQDYSTRVTQYAIQSLVTVNVLDARGLWTDPGLDASRRPVQNSESASIKNSWSSSSQSQASDVLSEVAEGSGGRFLENSNDFEGGLQKLAAAPEFEYSLSFAPQNLKMDGRYHALKVKLAQSKGFTVQARLGYWAPKALKDPVVQAKEEIRNAMFSREEVSELPVELVARTFKQPGGKSQIIVWARLSLKELTLRLAEGRSCNEVRFASAVFDSNGKLVSGEEKVIELRLSDATLARIRDTGITVRSDYIVKAGQYMVRMVVRDAEGQQLTAQNSIVDAP